MRQIVAGMDAQSPHVVVRTDRRKAIREALMWARPGDTMLIAGRGHEQTQTIGGTAIPFYDRDVTREELQK